VDNKDTKNLLRVKVRIGLAIDSNAEDKDLFWARPCLMGGAASAYGQFTVPPIGAQVWVMFENNQKESPVYIGGSINNGDAPSDAIYLPKDDLTYHKGIIFLSPKGSKFWYDDVKENGWMEIIRETSRVRVDKDFVGIYRGGSVGTEWDDEGIHIKVGGTQIDLTFDSIIQFASAIHLNSFSPGVSLRDQQSKK
jgi:hypothetical protein